MNLEQIDLLLLLIPALPLAAAVLTASLAPRALKGIRQLPAWLTVGSLAAAFVCSLLLIGEIQSRRGDRESFERVCTLWTWVHIPDAGPADRGWPDLDLSVSLRADTLTAMMLGMVTFVAGLVAVFSSGYMRGDRGEWRFFAYVSLFVFCMTMLVAASNFLLLFVFWEGVGVCSYLLIGFWYEKPAAAAAGKKAFLVNRVGDFGFALALFLIWTTYGTLNYHDTQVDPQTGLARHYDALADDALADDALAGDAEADAEPPQQVVTGVLGQSRAESQYRTGPVALAICLLLLLGACGKSAQLPLHVWLPDAMEGPTPVSALIHAATMVTAGVYMVARCSPLFMASPEAQLIVAAVGAVTALVAGLIALTQFDLKRVLAYSTISQLGYMFLALGAGTFAGITAGMFHLFTHAFFKALLFLGAGSVMHAMGHVIDMRRFGGLRKIMPTTHSTFLIGALALAGLFPLSGFWSKDGILAAVHARAHGQHESEQHEVGGRPPDAGRLGALPGGELPGGAAAPVAFQAEPAGSGAAPHVASATAYLWLYRIAMLAALLTPFYTFRAYLLTFHGPLTTPSEAGGHAHESPWPMTVPLVVLAVCAALAGLVFDRSYLPNPSHQFADFLASTPSLAQPSVAATRTAAQFHFDLAAVSTLFCLAGLGGAMFLYLGDRREVRRLTALMDLQWARHLTDVESVARLRQSPWVAGTYRDFQRLRLGWLARLLGGLVLMAVLILSAPLMLGQYLSPYKLSRHKFYFDELYGFFIVKPLQLLARLLGGLDRHLVDGLVDAVGRVPPLAGRLVRSLQTGLVPFYALAMIVCVLALIFARILMAG